MSRKMPPQRPGSSKQDVGTPPDFLEAVARRFGPLRVDLAARADNAVAPVFVTPEEDSLSVPWGERFTGKLAWLNPEFSDLDKWAAKCAREAPHHAARLRILLLTPASLDSNWFADHVFHHALVLSVRPRLTFVGHTDPYPKGCILSCYGFGVTGFELWRWK